MTTSAATVAPFVQRGLTFDADTHTYRLHGHALPGVTWLLRRYYLSRDWRDVEVGVLEAKRLLGSAVHAACHYADEGDLQPDTVDPRIAGYVDSWRLFRERTGFRPLLLETPLGHDLQRYAGTVDRFGVLGDGEPAIVDIKTGDPQDAAAGPQTAAYEALVRTNLTAIVTHLAATHGVLPWTIDELHARPWARYSVQLLGDPTPRLPFRLSPYTSFEDHKLFGWARSLEAAAHPSWRATC